MADNEDYRQGLRDGKIESLEEAVRELTVDMKKMKMAIYMMYGAIILVQILPEIKEFLHGQ